MIVEETTGALVLSARDGQAEAFEQLARRYLRVVYSVALAIVGRPSDAEDVAQTSMITAFEKIDSCRNPDRFGAWLMQISRNQSRNLLARRRFRDVSSAAESREQASNDASPELSVEAVELLKAMEILTPAQREVVLLHDLEGWTHPEISQSLEISVVMSRQHLFQARRRMRAILEPRRPSEEASNG